MIWHHYQFDGKILRANDPLTLWKSDRGSVSVNKDTLAVAITLNGEPQGYIFGGNGKMILDTIVETEQGAVGKPIEKELAEPFLVLGNLQNMESRVTPATSGEQKDFLRKAEEVYLKFFAEGQAFNFGCRDHRQEGLIFAFADDSGKFDLLILHGSRIVYKAHHIVFVSDEKRVVMRSPESTVVSHKGKCIIVSGQS
jgi:hypothetical protein